MPYHYIFCAHFTLSLSHYRRNNSFIFSFGRSLVSFSFTITYLPYLQSLCLSHSYLPFFNSSHFSFVLPSNRYQSSYWYFLTHIQLILTVIYRSTQQLASVFLSLTTLFSLQEYWYCSIYCSQPASLGSLPNASANSLVIKSSHHQPKSPIICFNFFPLVLYFKSFLMFETLVYNLYALSCHCFSFLQLIKNHLCCYPSSYLPYSGSLFGCNSSISSKVQL